jgi:hypothetical protein
VTHQMTGEYLLWFRADSVDDRSLGYATEFTALLAETGGALFTYSRCRPDGSYARFGFSWDGTADEVQSPGEEWYVLGCGDALDHHRAEAITKRILVAEGVL